MDPLDGLLPVWATWTPIVAYALTGALASLLASAVAAWIALRPYGKAKGAHWTEQARLAWAVRASTSVSVLAFPVFAGLRAGFEVGPLAALSPSTTGIASFLCGLFACLLVRYRSERRLRPKVVTAWRWVRGAAALTLIRLPHIVLTALALAATFLMPSDRPLLLLLLAAVTAAGLSGVALGGGTSTARLLGVVSPAGPRLADLVRRQAERTGTEVRGVFEVHLPLANAFALPVRKWLIVSDLALEELDDAELEAVIGHELGHLREPPAALAARLSPMLALLSLALVKPIVERFGLAGLVAVLVIIVAALLWASRVGRRMEERADAAASHIEAISGVYARALEKLYRSGLLPAVVPAKRMVHPHLYDRMLAAGVKPDYPRPQAPPRFAGVPSAAVGAFVGMTLAASFGLFVQGYVPPERAPESSLVASIGWSGGTAEQLCELARRRAGAGDVAHAILLYAAAAEQDRSNPTGAASAALLLASRGSCDEAEDSLLFANATGRGRRTRSDIVDRAWVAVDVCRRRKGEPLDEDRPIDEQRYRGE